MTRSLVLSWAGALLLGLAFGAVGCGDGASDGEEGGAGASGPGTGGTNGSGSGGSGTGAGFSVDGDGLGGDGASGGPVCAQESSGAAIVPVYLAFAFDVSGSMGKLDEPNWWHDPTVKWTPIVEATTAFFEGAAAEGISASMTLFPAAEDRCDEGSYEAPDVEMTSLPSTAFGMALGAYEAEVGTPLAGGDWRGGTPTLAAFAGTKTYVDALRAGEPNAKFAVVLVTDGLPQDCDDASLSDVVTEVESALADNVSTYVIGVENPTTPPASLPDGWDVWGCGMDDAEPCEPPANLSPLDQIAEAGGTSNAFLIDTGNPTATQEAFRAAIEAIRAEAISCTVTIPPHPSGGTFDKDRINVSFTADGETSSLSYDPDCAGADSWRYDDDESPTVIELCPETCAGVQSSTDGDLTVDFLCQPRPDVLR